MCGGAGARAPSRTAPLRHRTAVAHLELRRDADLFELAPEQARLRKTSLADGELDARRVGVASASAELGIFGEQRIDAIHRRLGRDRHPAEFRMHPRSACPRSGRVKSRASSPVLWRIPLIHVRRRQASNAAALGLSQMTPTISKLQTSRRPGTPRAPGRRHVSRGVLCHGLEAISGHL